MENHEYPVFISSPVTVGNENPHTSSSDTLLNESENPYEPSSTSDSEERPITQKRPHPRSETDTYCSDTQQPKHKKKNNAVSKTDSCFFVVSFFSARSRSRKRNKRRSTEREREKRRVRKRRRKVEEERKEGSGVASTLD